MIHPVDRAAGLVVRNGPRRLRFFSEGWGDPALLEPPNLSTAPLPAVHPAWVSKEYVGNGHLVRYGTYEVPDLDLPERSRRGGVMSIEPPHPHTRIVMLMAAWNEHDPKVRIAIGHLLAERDIASVIPENPFYGSRHPNPQYDQPIRTVSDFMKMGIAAVTEGRAILTGLRDPRHQLGVSGYSMGGNVAAIISATSDFPMATAPLAASHSPAPVFLDGVLRGGIAWDALGGMSEAPRLRSVLNSVSVLRVPAPPHAHQAVIVGGRTDGYIPETATQALADHWQESQLRTLRGGHATLVWYRKAALADAIVTSFDRTYGKS
ncbi:MAG: alpha/beta hydrolase family protein [Acidimicrobiia bacterium]|nr:alpha/beta hydrolase family protein [Acidimicrobiia bacterium]